jgi:hypothetical protein
VAGAGDGALHASFTALQHGAAFQQAICPGAMNRSRSLLRRLLPAAALALALAASTAASAQATWGEFAPHFRLTTGTGPGQINFADRTSPLALAVNSSDRSYFVADEPKTGEFRIQRFAGGTAGASISFSPSEKEHEAVELAADPTNQRVYALILTRRRGQSETELKAEEKEQKEFEEGKIKSFHPHFPLDSEQLVAGQLFAFEYTGGKLVSAKKTAEGTPAPVIPESQFRAGSELPREALLTPRGLTVDPKTGNVGIIGVQDEQSNEKVEKGEGEKECRAAAQFATPVVTAGVLTGAKLARRYVDHKDVVLPGQLTCGEQEVELSVVPFSPAVTPAGNLLFAAGGESETQVWEMPTPGTGSGEGEIEEQPLRLFTEATLATTNFELENPIGEVPTNVLSFVAEGPKQGRIYIAGAKHAFAQAPVALQYLEGEGGSPPQVSELGWTAGSESPPCGMPQQIYEGSLLGGFREGAGGASKEGVLVLDAFTELSTGTPRVETYAFGPGGSTAGCPGVTVAAPSATVGLNKNAHEVPAGQAVTLATTVTGANAKSTEWKLKHENPVTKEVVTEVINTGYQFEAPTLEHEFTQVGEYEITAVVTSDNLAREPAKSEEALKLKVTGSPPSIKFAPPKAVRVSEEGLELSATVKDPNEGSTVTLKKVLWSFGDGSAPVETKVEPGQPNPILVHVTHTFISRCGKGKCVVTLTVEDASGQTAKGAVEVTVTESKAEAEAAKRKAEEEAAAKRKAEEEAAAAAAKHAEEEAAAAAKHKAEEEAAAAARHKAEEEASKGKGGVLAFVARVAGSMFPVNPSGAVAFKLSCEAGAASCTGTVTLKTLTAVKAGGKRKSIVTLASGSFSLSGGQTRTLTLHLSSKARALLASAHVLRARATVVSRASNGTSQATPAVVTLKLVKKHH